MPQNENRACDGTQDAADSIIAGRDDRFPTTAAAHNQSPVGKTGEPTFVGHAPRVSVGRAESPNLTARLEYAARGWWTFPAPTDGAKKSLKSEEYSSTRWGATLDPDIIRDEFRGHRFRNQNVGIMCGVESGIFVIETDTAEHGDGIDGEAVLNAWETDHGALPETLKARSPSGSLHRFFRHPGPDIKIKTFAAILGEGSGVDSRGDGGMVIGVPSVMPPRPASGDKPAKVGGVYMWVNAGHPIADAPQALLDVVIEQPPPEAQSISQKALALVNVGRAATAGNGERAWANAALDAECKILANTPSGNRNDQLNRSAFNLGQIVGGGALGESEVIDALMQAAAANGVIRDDGNKACEATIKSGLTDGKAKPRRYQPKNDADAKQKTTTPSRQTTTPSRPVAPANSEEFLSLAFADRHETDLRFVAKWGQWFRWDKTRWLLEETLHAFDMARLICREAANACNKAGVAKGLASAKTVAAVERLAKADRKLAATFEQWDTDSNKLNNPGGGLTMATIELTNGTSYPPRREDYITQQTACAMAPAGTPHPVWDAFLLRVTAGDTELIKFLQRFIGYCLTGHTKEHVFLFLFGTGRNGKGTFINTIMKIFGDYATVASISTFLASKSDRHPTEIAKLRGKRLVVAQETPAGRVWDEAKIKSVTGGDRMSAHFMRQDDFEFDPVFKLIISGNHKPRLNCVDVAIRARLLIVPFTVEIPASERDLDLMDKLRAEWPAILRWAMDGCLEWQRIGLKPPASVTAATEAYFSGEDTFTQWLEDECEVEHNNKYKIAPVGDLYASWSTYCKDNGDEPGSKKAFSEQMQTHGFAPVKVGHAKTRSFSGIQLKARGAPNDREPDEADGGGTDRTPHF